MNFSKYLKFKKLKNNPDAFIPCAICRKKTFENITPRASFLQAGGVFFSGNFDLSIAHVSCDRKEQLLLKNRKISLSELYFFK